MTVPRSPPVSEQPSSAEPTPFSLYPVAPGQPAKPGVLTGIGASTVGIFSTWNGLFNTLFGVIEALYTPGDAARSVMWRIAIRQVFFTGYQALPLVSMIALFVGATIIIQMQIMAAGIPGEIVGQILVAVILRELAPLVTAIIVAGRSGTAIATELGNMKANAEVHALASMGIDPMRFIVLPRMFGAVVSVLILTLYFGVIAILGGYVVGVGMSAGSFAAFRAGFSEALQPADAILYVVKGVGLGTIVGWFCCHFGLQVSNSPTEVPQRSSQAVVMSLLTCVAYNTAITAGFYWIVGPPVQ